MNILENLQIPLVATEELPKTFAPLTNPIPLAKSELIQSIWENLRLVPVVATVEEDRLVFWRRPVDRGPRHPKCSVKTR